MHKYAALLPRESVHVALDCRVAWKFCGSFILRIGDFLWLAGTNFLRFEMTEKNIWWEVTFAIIYIQVAEYLSGRNLNMVFQLLFYGMLSQSSLCLHHV